MKSKNSQILDKNSQILDIINNVIYSLRRNSNFSCFNSYNSSLNGNFVLENSEIILNSSFRLKEQDILRNFTILKFKLLKDFDTDQVLFPFLEIIKSGITTGHVTLIAIEGISFILKEFETDNVNLQVLVEAVTKCKFEATDSVNDEIVLANILLLLKKITFTFSKRLELKEILDILQVSLGMYFQNRISEFLKREALSTLSTLAEEMSFNSLITLEILKVISGLLDQENRNNIDSVHRNLGLYLLQAVMNKRGSDLAALISSGLKNNSRRESLVLDKKSFLLAVTKEEVNVKELQLQKIQEVPHLNLAQDVKSPVDQKEDEFVNVAKITKELIGNDICKAAFQLIQAYDLSFNAPPSWPIISLIHQALKSLCSLFRTNRLHLKYQLDWFIMWCIKIVDSGLLCWNVEDWMGPIGSEHNSQTSQSEQILPKKRDILIGEIREMVLATLYTVIIFGLTNS
jgi:hypothetical protein